MLGDIADIIAKELNLFLANKLTRPAEDTLVKLWNPANSEKGPQLPDGVYFSLLNIEEELYLREGSVSRRVVGNSIETTQPAVNVNLQVIFIASFQNDYKAELNLIYWVMAFFQVKPLFNLSNTPELSRFGFSGDDKLLFELNTLPLRELHYIWGNLGMKQMPSITYQIKMLKIQNSATLKEGGVVDGIDLVKRG